MFRTWQSGARARRSPFLSAASVAVAACVAVGTVPVAAAAPRGEERREPVRYTVRRGDTLGRIAKRHDLEGRRPWRRIYRANPQLRSPHRVRTGRTLWIPFTLRQARTLRQERLERMERRARRERRAARTDRQKRRTALDTRTERRERRASRDGRSWRPRPGSAWDRLARCESGGNWSINTGNGYYGGLQFSRSSWRAVGGRGYPHHASARTQVRMGKRLRAIQGWGAWPACSAKLGL